MAVEQELGMPSTSILVEISMTPVGIFAVNQEFSLPKQYNLRAHCTDISLQICAWDCGKLPLSEHGGAATSLLKKTLPESL